MTVVSGHDLLELDLAALARTPGTLVVFMGLASLAALADGLIRHGKPADTPTAVVSSGTLPGQQSVVAPLAEIADTAAELEPPALVVIGDVVALAGSLAAHELLAAAAAA